VDRLIASPPLSGKSGSPNYYPPTCARTQRRYWRSATNATCAPAPFLSWPPMPPFACFVNGPLCAHANVINDLCHALLLREFSGKQRMQI
jgi:hypothetical protein